MLYYTEYIVSDKFLEYISIYEWFYMSDFKLKYISIYVGISMSIMNDGHYIIYKRTEHVSFRRYQMYI